MEYRMAIMADLPQLQSVYKKRIVHMNSCGIDIWDDIYPCEFFKEDISNQSLYVLMDDKVPVAAFALCETNGGEAALEWENAEGRALYLDRLGVNVDYARQGIGSLMLLKAKETAKNKKAEYLRLFVVNINEPAIALYEKNGFKKLPGICDEVIDETLVLHEYGYEVKL